MGKQHHWANVLIGAMGSKRITLRFCEEEKQVLQQSTCSKYANYCTSETFPPTAAVS